MDEKKSSSFLMNFFKNICIALIIGSLYFVVIYFIDDYNYRKNTEQINRKYDKTLTATAPDGTLKRFLPLLEENSETVGYLYVGDTDATGPVVQTKDNDFYLQHDFYKNKNRFGARFLDYRNKITKNGIEDKNLTIYGHYNDDNLIFAELNKYKDLDFYRKNPIIEFDTLYQKTKWKVFAIFITNSDPKHGGLFVYNRQNFANDEEFADYLIDLRRRTIIDTGVTADTDDALLTLSTCSRTFKDARFVVVAKKIKPNESEKVNVKNAKLNPAPLYPDIWYTEVDRTAVKPIY